MTKKIIQTYAAPEAIGPYSQAVVAGNTLYCSGQIPLVPGTGEFLNANITEATEQSLKNLSAVIAAAGGSLADVVKVTVYLKNLEDYPAMNEVYAKYFGADGAPPARACVEVARLPKDSLVEIDAIVLLP